MLNEAAAAEKLAEASAAFTPTWSAQGSFPRRCASRSSDRRAEPCYHRPDRHHPSRSFRLTGDSHGWWSSRRLAIFFHRELGFEFLMSSQRRRSRGPPRRAVLGLGRSGLVVSKAREKPSVPTGRTQVPIIRSVPPARASRSIASAASGSAGRRHHSEPFLLEIGHRGYPFFRVSCQSQRMISWGMRSIAGPVPF
jgi:hypothetical protein